MARFGLLFTPVFYVVCRWLAFGDRSKPGDDDPETEDPGDGEGDGPREPATEVKPPLLADAIVDVSETGSSIRANNLRVLETIAAVPDIVEMGGEAWSSLGKLPGDGGVRIYGISGHVKNPGHNQHRR